MRTALGTIVMLIATSAIAQDHLRPEAGDLWNQDEYYTKIRKVFADSLRHDIIVELVFVPSFQPEEIIGIRKKGEGFEAFASKPSSHIWSTFNIREIETGKQRWFDEHGKPIPPEKNPSLSDLKKRAPSDFGQIRVHTDARPLSAALTERIRVVWQNMVLQAQEARDRGFGVDGEDFHFSLPLPGRGTVSATVWSPSSGKTLALVNLAQALADYARRKADQRTLSKLLEPLEPKKA
jgi:hypothetical protein